MLLQKAAWNYMKATYAIQKQYHFLRQQSNGIDNQLFRRRLQHISSRSFATEFFASRDLNQNDSIDDQLIQIELEAKRLTNQDINLNSPRQVASVLYGGDGDGGTSKQILQQFVVSTDLDDEKKRFQRDFSLLVLEYRKVKRKVQDLNKISPDERNERTNIEGSEEKSKKSDISRLKQSTSPTSALQTMAFSTVSTLSESDNKQNDMVKSLMSPEAVTYSDRVNTLFNPIQSKKKSKIDKYWEEALQSLTKPSAKAIVAQLDPSCPMGYNPQATPNMLTNSKKAVKKTTSGMKGTLLAFVREEKLKNPTNVILTRVGEFYEAFGIDAILLIEYCGLNSMGGKARAGCPIQNVQATLDDLTSSGFKVAVYEEVNDIATKQTKSKGRLKSRMLAQVVSPASPSYLYDLVLKDSGTTKDALYNSPSARPYIGVIHSASGYSVVEVFTEERLVRVTERVTAEAVACRLSSNPPADPLFYVPSMKEEEMSASGTSGLTNKLPFLPSRWSMENEGQSARRHVKTVPPSLYLEIPRPNVSDIERYKNCILSAIRATLDDDNSDNRSENYILLATDDNEMRNLTNPLYSETAIQLGLMEDPHIPSLVKYLLPATAPKACGQFLRRWLLTPPPPSVAKAMSQLIDYMKHDSPALPVFEIPPTGKLLSLIRAGEASDQIFREILGALKATIQVIDLFADDSRSEEVTQSLMKILRFESGLVSSAENLKNRCLDAIQLIEEVVLEENHFQERLDQISIIKDDIIPPVFLERNEATWRGRIKREASGDAYDTVEAAARALIEAVKVDFWGYTDVSDSSTTKESKNPVLHDYHNNLINLKAIPTWTKDKDAYYHPHDRYNKIIRSRYTTQRVEDALSKYVEACDYAKACVEEVLKTLSQTLCETGHLPAITQASHTNLILFTSSQHAAQANSLGWEIPEIFDGDEGDVLSACRFVDLHPYWMDKSDATLNSFDLDGMFLLTAPNMSGKSTIMRSAAAAALLAVCGFCAPVAEKSFVKRFDSLFVRGASADIPTENKSAFGAEMGDISALLRACSNKSLVFVDELGRGTSPKDGTSLAGAVLEDMAKTGMKGFFATHLHSILEMPLCADAKKNILNKRMEFLEEGNEFRWTYKLADGVCTDSKALKTAERFGIPNRIILRAEELSYFLDSQGQTPLLPAPIVRKMSESSNDHEDIVGPDGAKNRDFQSEALLIIEELSGEPPVCIEPKWSPPAKLEGVSIVYVLSFDDRFYVGETDKFAARLRKHRYKPHLTNAFAMAVVVEGGKTDARNLESRLIQRMVREGFDMISTTDGRKIKPRNR